MVITSHLRRPLSSIQMTGEYDGKNSRRPIRGSAGRGRRQSHNARDVFVQPEWQGRRRRRLRPNQSVALAGRCRAQCGPSALEASVRLYGLVPHHLPVLHDRLGRMAHGARGTAPQERATGIPGGVRVLAQDLRRGVRTRGRFRDRDGVPVRHELERPCANVGAHPGTASLL